MNAQTLQKKLADLDIFVSKNEAGGFSVHTTCEPLFCFDRKTEAEIDLVVVDTLTSYIKTFYNDSNTQFMVSMCEILKTE